MNKTKIIGLTGGIGSGKSSVLQLFKNKGVPIYMADLEAKELMQKDEQLIQKIKSAFGNESYKDGILNRSFLAEQVFKDKEKLHILNNLVHPAVRKHFREYLSKINTPFVIYENAILFENGFDKDCDYIITVTAPLEVRLKRVMQRDKISKKQILLRMQHQWDDSKKVKKSHYVINNLNWENTEKEVDKIYNDILSKISSNL